MPEHLKIDFEMLLGFAHSAKSITEVRHSCWPRKPGMQSAFNFINQDIQSVKWG